MFETHLHFVLTVFYYATVGFFRALLVVKNGSCVVAGKGKCWYRFTGKRHVWNSRRGKWVRRHTTRTL